ncbi:nonsense-mediated mRNA decay factor SMG5-like [Biomphalaria glabrata]|uniref:Nonsense-mediated mRNA decay factor SMG5-like n=1 Tax=Biomphalaria glabrata TaxID=6526 RepID=A0A9W2ZR83_BIOGL|nr:nonsense-mediated mRNA decay factor SMG5-like [Biomphalaria glabrata]KAI8793396.1 protein SMG5 [Biomphalaria glabrata]
MKKRAEPSNGSKSDADRAKRVYRAALESLKRLDSINKEKKAYREVFRQDAVGLRNKLKENCERLMFFNPIEYGRKAEEVLWRRVFYDVIQVVKHSKDHVRHHGSVETAYRTHLAAAAGYYQHLVFRLQREFSLRLAGVIDYHLIPEPRTGRRSDTSSVKTINPSVQEWAQRACHRCLICLGDISRYICDVDPMSVPTTADRYYHQAFMLFPEIGMPHNQLGTLAGSRYSGCEAAYHYVRCLACEKPFDGARGNLTRLFEKNAKKFYELNKPQPRDLPPDEQRHQDIKRFFTRFLKLLEILHSQNNNIEMVEVQQLCQHTLQDFNLCMFYEPQNGIKERTGGHNCVVEEEDSEEFADPGDPSSFQYLDNGIVFKIVCCLICTIHLLEKNGSSNITAATAFLLALLSHILNHVVIRLQGGLEDIEHPNKIFIAGSSLTNENVPSDESSVSDEEITQQTTQEKSAKNGSSKTDSKKSRLSNIRNLRRRKRWRQLSESSEEMSDLSEASDLSEGNEGGEDQIISSDSDDDALASYFDHGSDSDLSETEDISDSDAKINTNNANSGTSDDHNKWPPPGKSLPNGDMKHIWSNGTGDNSLAHISSELFSSSLMFLGQDLAHNSQVSDLVADQKEVPIPPGFNSSEEAKHVAEITEKLANFDIETDTETNFLPTDTEQSVTETDEADNEQSTSSNTEKSELEQRRLQQTLEVVHNQGLLPTVKIMCDWMTTQTTIISVCAQSSFSLWQRLSVLLNFLPHENDIAQHNMCWVPELQVIATQTRFADWAQVFPLTEDIEVCQLPPLSDIHSQIDFTTRHRAQLSELQETFLRICCLRRFGYFLTNVENIEFTYQPETAMFFGPSSDSVKNNSQDTMTKMKESESRRNQLMRDMAQLRLQAEVSELEGSLKSAEHPVFPPYVVVDDAALCSYLSKVKELAGSARCIVVIPLAVVDSLDLQKKDSANAREAIRWLEAQLRKGNRYIRAQKPKETLSTQQHGLLKKRNREAWYYLELLGCARYLAQQTGTFTGHSVVAVLTGQQKLMTPPIQPVIAQVKTSSEQEGVTIDTVMEFNRKWKSVLLQQGKG